jgi:hypothetical protein
MTTGPRRRSAVRTTITLIIIAVCVSRAGCRDVGTTWSAEVRSPDGLWHATARSQQWGRPERPMMPQTD